MLFPTFFCGMRFFLRPPRQLVVSPPSPPVFFYLCVFFTNSFFTESALSSAPPPTVSCFLHLGSLQCMSLLPPCHPAISTLGIFYTMFFFSYPYVNFLFHKSLLQNAFLLWPTVTGSIYICSSYYSQASSLPTSKFYI
jgi:hypothetical protein